jgi:hypothetical protein
MANRGKITWLFPPFVEKERTFPLWRIPPPPVAIGVAAPEEEPQRRIKDLSIVSAPVTCPGRSRMV